MLAPKDKLIEDFGLFFENYGLPRIFGRIYGLLLITDEPHLSLEQIASELKISKASASTIARQLLATTMIEKSTIPGDRRDFYRVGEGSHIDMMRAKLRASLALSALIHRGGKLEGLAPATQKRLKRVMHFYDEAAIAIDRFFENYRYPEEVEDEPTPRSESTQTR